MREEVQHLLDRAVDYAFQTREKFPDRRIFITGDMIHNVSMNDRLREMGIEFLSTGFDGPSEEAFDRVAPDDVVLLPAFGAPIDWVEKLREKGLHQHHPRQVLPRGDEGHRLPDLQGRRQRKVPHRPQPQGDWLRHGLYPGQDGRRRAAREARTRDVPRLRAG